MRRLDARRAWRHMLAPVVLGLAVGCQTGPGERVPAPAPEGAPTAEAILTDLATGSDGLVSLYAKGLGIVESPEFDGRRAFYAKVAFERPDKLFIEGRHRPSNRLIFLLKSVGSEYLVTLPTQNEHWHRLEGERYESVPFSVSPSDIAREMFLPEEWRSLRPADLEIRRYDAENSTAEVDIVGRRDQVRRRLTVAGPPWRVVASDRIEDGRAIAKTRLAEYRTVEGLFLPMRVATEFPYESTGITFELREIEPNVELPDDTFHIDWPRNGQAAAEQPAAGGNRGRIGP